MQQQGVMQSHSQVQRNTKFLLLSLGSPILVSSFTIFYSPNFNCHVQDQGTSRMVTSTIGQRQSSLTAVADPSPYWTPQCLGIDANSQMIPFPGNYLIFHATDVKQLPKTSIIFLKRYRLRIWFDFEKIQCFDSFSWNILWYAEFENLNVMLNCLKPLDLMRPNASKLIKILSEIFLFLIGDEHPRRFL